MFFILIGDEVGGWRAFLRLTGYRAGIEVAQPAQSGGTVTANDENPSE